MRYTIMQLHKHLYKKVYDTYDVFRNFFGEERVDLQDIRVDSNFYLAYMYRNSKDAEDTYEISEEKLQQLENICEKTRCTIYVWWPRVTVTNENNKSIDIQDLYAEIIICGNGTIPYVESGFKLNRATYPITQFKCNYMHSHIDSIPKKDFTIFQFPCLGTGPINNTIGSLRNEYNEITWMLFCQELNMYVTVESLTGIPYKKLENVGSMNRLWAFPGYDFNNTKFHAFTSLFGTENLKEFIVYYLEHGNLSLSYKYGKYTWGMFYYKYIIDISNIFIEFYNKHLKVLKSPSECFANNLLYRGIVADESFYSTNSTIKADKIIEQYRDKPVLQFKGKTIYTTIIDDTSKTPPSTVILLSNSIAMAILDKILTTINFRYKNEHNKTGNQSDFSSSNKRIVYL